MTYQIVYAKTTPAIAYRATLAEAEQLARRMERLGYTVSIWERSESSARPVR